jgi:hypothetical protein
LFSCHVFFFVMAIFLTRVSILRRHTSSRQVLHANQHCHSFASIFTRLSDVPTALAAPWATAQEARVRRLAAASRPHVARAAARGATGARERLVLPRAVPYDRVRVRGQGGCIYRHRRGARLFCCCFSVSHTI